jgi:hypothetical protein
MTMIINGQPTEGTSLIREVNAGFSVAYTDAHTITLTPTGIGGIADFTVTSGTDRMYIQVTAALTCDIAAAGAGGLDTGAEAASTCYECRLIYKPSTGTKALLFTVSGSAPTLPAGYTHYSRVITAAANNGSSNFYAFTQLGGVYEYRGIDRGIVLLGEEGVAKTPTAVDLSKTTPSVFTEAWGFYRASNSNGTDLVIYIYEDSGGLYAKTFGRAGALAGNNSTWTGLWRIHKRGQTPATCMYYAWTGDAGVGFLPYLHGFSIPGVI